MGSYLLSDGQFTEEKGASACRSPHIVLAYDLIASPVVWFCSMHGKFGA